MLNVPDRPLSSTDPQSLVAWLYQAIGLQQIRIHTRLRGNHLYVLCEGKVCPSQTIVFGRLVRSLSKTDVQPFVSSDQPQIYQVVLYGRALGQARPQWADVIYLNQLDRHLEKLSNQGDSKPHTAIVLANIALAKQGKPEAIARYLSEALNSLGVSVRASVKAIPMGGEIAQPLNRLWVMCESAYSPDPSLVAQAIPQKLRDLELTGFREAIVHGQVQGESNPDWQLRVDLTPPDEMLREWARWGDLKALDRLLNRALGDQTVQISATLKETTLHLTCQTQGTLEPQKPRVMAAIAPLLDTIAPQGIHAVTVYGSEPAVEADVPASPTWIEWLDLPAKIHPALSDSTETLARQGDLPAIAFLLTRLLNPDLDRQLSTGGIRLQVRRKEDLLHILTESPLCPSQTKVGTAIGTFLKPLAIPDMTGARIYGRRSGQTRPAWSYGVNFVSRSRLVPEATPEFAASDAYVGDLMAEPGELIVRPELTTNELRLVLDRMVESVQDFLTRSQLFVPTELSAPGSETASMASSYPQGVAHTAKVAIVWGTLGLLLTVQTDWIVGQLLKSKVEPAPKASPVQPAPAQKPAPSEAMNLPNLSLQKSGVGRWRASDGSFTQSGQTVIATDSPNRATSEAAPRALLAAPLRPKAVADAARSPYPTFNARQLDEKLVLYRQFVAQHGAPDVLVLGSSRAMRGIDPVTLQQSLAAQGYPGQKVFNFGVNGATAQVIDLIVRHLLPAEKMPKLILWADGSRAFNSGRLDITYNAIAVSPGFKKLPTDIAAAPAKPAENALGSSIETIAVTNTSVSESYQTVNTLLNQSLAKLSSVYNQRESLKNLFRQGITGQSKPGQDTETIAQDGQGLVDIDGFLPIANRFNPATYYQKYSRVTGANDSDYDNFSLEGRQQAAIASLAKFTQAQKIPLVFVNLPLTGEYLDPARSGHEQAFQQHMIKISSEMGFTYRNLVGEWTTENDFFSDPSHLNRYGAYVVSQHIAKDPLIPWVK
ncbi:hypothetical protein ACKFKF_30940 [Phormidesmis sp. 146-12]